MQIDPDLTVERVDEANVLAVGCGKPETIENVTNGLSQAAYMRLLDPNSRDVEPCLRMGQLRFRPKFSERQTANPFGNTCCCFGTQPWIDDVHVV
jgi:hypothetical protein